MFVHRPDKYHVSLCTQGPAARGLLCGLQEDSCETWHAQPSIRRSRRGRKTLALVVAVEQVVAKRWLFPILVLTSWSLSRLLRLGAMLDGVDAVVDAVVERPGQAKRLPV